MSRVFPKRSTARQPIRLSTVTSVRNNNFDALRLSAAALVLVSHSFALTGRRDPIPTHTLGTLGVELFFVTSGFLVAASWLNEPRVRLFLLKRALRILPGLFVAVIVTTTVIGSIFVTGSWDRYLASGEPWTYVVRNALLVPQYNLPGLFVTHANHALNSSLWTLPIEARCYLLLALVGFAGLVTRRAVAPATVAIFIAALIFGAGSEARLYCMFIAGTAAYLFRDRITLRFDIALVLMVAWALTYTTQFSVAAGMIALPYLVAWFAYRISASLRRVAAKGDVSYGIYIYAFPIQQALVAAGIVSPLLLIAGRRRTSSPIESAALPAAAGTAQI
jgi:peptidoglycan/LPS O-acetylase OafA/YrhL